MAQRNVTLPTVHHLGHLGGNAARRAPERLEVVFVDRVSVYRPKAVRATFAKTEDIEEVVDDAHHQVAHQGDPFRCHSGAPNAPLFGKAHVEEIRSVC